MAFRIVQVTSHCKLETRLNYLVCMKDKETKILLDEIAMVIIESQQACITTALITDLIEHGIKVIFCDGKHNPIGEILPYAGSKDSYKKIKLQMQWDEETKNALWNEIIRLKIHNQKTLLRILRKEDTARILEGYENQVEDGDKTNREGLAAKVYFAALFGSAFERRDSSIKANTYLDYGYSVLLGIVNREIASFGYLPQIGIHHIGETNPFNLGCDLMEPFRPFVDSIVCRERIHGENFKRVLLDGFGMPILCGERKTILDNAIHVFLISFLNAMNEKNPKRLEKVVFLDEQL